MTFNQEIKDLLTDKDEEMLSALTGALSCIIDWRTSDYQSPRLYWETYGQLACLWIELEKYMNQHLKEQPVK